jgi:glycosyltransferase-like protein
VTPRIGLVTYSTRPRGGVVHTLSLAEALCRLGADVTVVALGERFFRPVAAPCVLVPAPPRATDLEARVFDAVDALAAGLAPLAGRFDVLHAQDCIAARAAVQARAGAGGPAVVRTVHHMDDFTTPALVDCQLRSIREPDRVLVVSRWWQERLRDEYGVAAEVVYNGVDVERFGRAVDPARRAALRAAVGAGPGDGDRFVFLAVGGIEPRKGTVHLFAALGRLKRSWPGGPAGPPPVLAVVGGHSFQDYAAYREQALGSLGGLGLAVGDDVVLLGTVDDDDLLAWYGSADALAFPSVKEGWGLAVLEAMAAGLPVVATDIPVFREYLVDGESALLVPPADPAALSVAMASLVHDAVLRDRLRTAGRAVASRYSWTASARRHLEVYRSVFVA